MKTDRTEAEVPCGTPVDRHVRAPAPERAEFEAWLERDHMLKATWDDGRKCYVEFPAHLAWKAWRAANAWIPMSERKPRGGQLIVKRWRHGAVWAGTHNEGAKNEAFDEWKAL